MTCPAWVLPVLTTVMVNCFVATVSPFNSTSASRRQSPALDDLILSWGNVYVPLPERAIDDNVPPSHATFLSKSLIQRISRLPEIKFEYLVVTATGVDSPIAIVSGDPTYWIVVIVICAASPATTVMEKSFVTFATV